MLSELTTQENNLIRSQSYINGEWVQAASGKIFEVSNPATGEVMATVPDMSREDVRKAIDAAHDAWPSYRDLTAKERAALLKKWYALILEHKQELARLMTMECGKVLQESLGEVEYGAGFIEWFAEEAKRTYGDVIPANTKDKRIVVIKQSIGVAAAITPWNFPLAMITRKVGPALAAGSPVVVKPPSETPLTALAISYLAEKAGFPPGVYNTVTTTDNSEVGKEFCENKKVRKLSFTGSTPVGKILMSQCASTLKKLSLELGGNAPFIVFNDADVDAAVKGAIVSKFRNSGQTCVCVNRIYAQDNIYDEFVEKLSKAVAALTVGNGLDKGVQIGPLINEKGLAKVKRHVEDALSKGATIIQGGKPMDGLFYEPTVLADVTRDMIISQDEVFGPAAPVSRFSTEEEVIQLANDTDYGLASYFYTQDMARCWRVAEALESGMVGINEGLISTEVAPFGGIKESGLGREGSKYGMDYYMEIKYLCFGGIK
ncbi:NAD-dependent succinate-semialdehyde dehydrogenase [Rhodocytophaga rosea]|uniref:NAD-dependent succinate-semialdehyde dehydrogenase n=1 Tax=Rhodocytophaga rosea TaxID=2704465 RepID=A0A6C0GCH4_9BACT|nr:NAD-dependent succinate-semialdehyde dehydrogenase [Rhodocytophaga rosea]QHT65689.1 NAD-dependent succinate-semialdehyde dehydrogenase [Rhodocytophaga rosea]